MRCAKRNEHLGWPEDKQFYIPDEALKHFREAVDRGAQQESDWNALVENYEQKHAELGQAMAFDDERRTAGGLGKALAVASPMRNRWRRALRAAKSSMRSRRTCRC